MNAEIKKYKDEIQYGKPSVFFTKDKYVTQIDNLLRISNEQDQSV